MQGVAAAQQAAASSSIEGDLADRLGLPCVSLSCFHLQTGMCANSPQGMAPISAEKVAAAGSKAYVDACVAMGMVPNIKVLKRLLASDDDDETVGSLTVHSVGGGGGGGGVVHCRHHDDAFVVCVRAHTQQMCLPRNSKEVCSRGSSSM